MTTDSGPGRESGTDAPLVHIFADESCLGNQFENRRNPGAAAGLIERFDERRGWYRRDFAHFDPDTTNNRMAITSGIVGLGALRQACRVVFTSDSQYLIRGMKEWVHGWARRGWRRKGGPIENLDLWRELVRIAARHILPNLMPTVIILTSISMAGAVLAEATLSFLGVGVPPPAQAWGSMLSGTARVYFLSAPWFAIWPGVFISLTVLSWNLAGDALRDILDPRLRGE